MSMQTASRSAALTAVHVKRASACCAMLCMRVHVHARFIKRAVHVHVTQTIAHSLHEVAACHEVEGYRALGNDRHRGGLIVEGIHILHAGGQPDDLGG